MYLSTQRILFVSLHRALTNVVTGSSMKFSTILIMLQRIAPPFVISRCQRKPSLLLLQSSIGLQATEASVQELLVNSRFSRLHLLHARVNFAPLIFRDLLKGAECAPVKSFRFWRPLDETLPTFLWKIRSLVLFCIAVTFFD